MMISGLQYSQQSSIAQQTSHHTVMNTQSAYFEQLRNLLAELTGNEAGDIHPDSLLIEDLGIADEADLPRIVKRINAHFDIHLVAAEVAEEADTVEELLMLITDEAELG